MYQKKDVLEAQKILFNDFNTQLDSPQFQKYDMKFLFLYAKNIFC